MTLSYSGSSRKTIIEGLESALLPLEKATPLPAHFYKSDEILDLEKQLIFSKEWLCIGRDDEVPDAGDFVRLDILDEPLVMTRAADGEVRVLSAVCKHRGAILVEGRGNRRNFECPFHGWVYGMDGRLMGAPHMQKTEGFNAKKCPLPSVRTEIWNGFVFINFDADAKPLAPRLRGVEKLFANYKIKDMRAAGLSLPFVNECNWKLSVEQGIDMYHVPASHPEVGHFYEVADGFGEEDPSGTWTTSFTPCTDPHPYVSGTKLEKSAFPAIEGLTEFELSSFNMFLIYPNSLFACVPDGILYFSFMPDGPHRTNVQINLGYPESTTKMEDFEEHVIGAIKGIEELNYQDMNGAKITHAGMGSQLFDGGRFSHLERTTWELGKYVANKLKGSLSAG